MFEGFERRRVRVGEVEINVRVGGNGRPLLLLHGYPQTHVMWHRVAPALARHFTVIVADLRGYGDSSKPPDGIGHASYSKRVMASDQAQVMSALGFGNFMVAGHDRGGRVAERMALDYPERIQKMAILDIIPFRLMPDMFRRVDPAFGYDTYHWFFLAQPSDFPERMIAASPEFFLRWTLGSWGAVPGWLDEEAFAEYLRCFRDPACIHATCEDYRAGLTVDATDNEADADQRIRCPVLSLWGTSSKFGGRFDPIAFWKSRADRVSGRAVPGGHFIAEEAPVETREAMLEFFGD
jgi:haloacetate dehalogenase